MTNTKEELIKRISNDSRIQENFKVIGLTPGQKRAAIKKIADFFDAEKRKLTAEDMGNFIKEVREETKKKQENFSFTFHPK